jgi:histidine ammonia-lyase
LALGLTQVGNLVEKRLHRLLDTRFSGLPEQLSRDPGRQSGLVILHKQVIGLAAEARTLAAPAMIHPSDGSTGQEDFQAHTMLTARQLARILDSLESLSPTSWRRCVTHPTWRRHPFRRH